MLVVILHSIYYGLPQIGYNLIKGTPTFRVKIQCIPAFAFFILTWPCMLENCLASQNPPSTKTTVTAIVMTEEGAEEEEAKAIHLSILPPPKKN